MKKFLKKLFNKFGLEIRRLNSNSDFEKQIVVAMKKKKIDVLFDIGANIGQFSHNIRMKGYKGKIVSFEPLTKARDKLLHQAKKDPNWIIHDRVAIGDRNDFVDINISKNSYSSSILPMLNLHSEAAIGSNYTGIEKTQIVTLDSVSETYLDKYSNCFIKIDTQGYETKVLNGAIKTLKRAKGVLCELTLVPLYQGQDLWTDLIIRLEKEGFVLWSLERGFTDNRDGRTLQIDGLFIRKNS